MAVTDYDNTVRFFFDLASMKNQTNNFVHLFDFFWLFSFSEVQFLYYFEELEGMYFNLKSCFSITTEAKYSCGRV